MDYVHSAVAVLHCHYQTSEIISASLLIKKIPSLYFIFKSSFASEICDYMDLILINIVNYFMKFEHIWVILHNQFGNLQVF